MRSLANKQDQKSVQEAFVDLHKMMVFDQAWAAVETLLITLHEEHIRELDIPFVISQLEPEKRELPGLLGLPYLDTQGISRNLD